MKPRRPALSPFAAPSLVLVTLVTTLAVAGCAVQTEGSTGPSENPTAADGKLTRPHCPAGQHLESSNEGPGGSLLYYCMPDDPSPVTGPPPGTNSAACSNNLAVPAGLAGQGCFPGTSIWSAVDAVGDTDVIPVFFCPVSAKIPALLNTYVEYLPPCSATITNNCAYTFTFTQISGSCVGDAPPGWEYVTEIQVYDRNNPPWPVGKHPVVGGSCGGGCSSIYGFPNQ